MESFSSKVVREWTLEREIGRGAMGAIYRATHRFNEGYFALKVLRSDKATSRDLRDRFLREARVAASLKHENIVDTLPAFEEQGRLYIPMQMLRGNSITTLLQARDTPWPVDAVTTWMHQAARGLAYAHGAGVIHRDVKPGNLFVCDDGRTLKLLDFGLARSLQEARLTATGLTVGTPMYLAPEVIEGHDADHRSDIYALGVVMFRLLTRRLPFQVPKTKNAFALAHGIRKQLMERIPRIKEHRPEVPSGVDDLVFEMLTVNASNRIQTAAEVAERLPAELVAPPLEAMRIYRTEPVEAPVDAPTRPARPSSN